MGSSGPLRRFGRRLPRRVADGRVTLLMSGPGVFAVDSRATIIKEVTRLSILSTIIIVALLLGVYRSATALLLGLVPVASGALAGVAAVALGLGVVHGITLGFGITLIGEAVDYSIYLFIQSRQGQLQQHQRNRSIRTTADRSRHDLPTTPVGCAPCGRPSASECSPPSAGLPRCCPRGFRASPNLGFTPSPAWLPRRW